MTTRSATVASTEPVPPAFQNSSSTPAARSASATSRRRTSSWVIDSDLIRRTTAERARCDGHLVLDAGDLALVGHRADQPEARPVLDLLGQSDHVVGVVER